MKEMAFYAQKRSGHHAVINWLRFQLPGVHVFLNACKPSGSPLTTCALSQSRIGYRERDIRLRRAMLYPALKLSVVRYLLYNYEDYLPPSTPISCCGSTTDPVAFVILRSPANLLASRMIRQLTFHSKHEEMTPEILAEKLSQVVKTWIDFAQLYLEGNYFCIYYDKWLTDLDYKRTLMERLNIVYREPTRDEIAQWGPGSSFEGDEGIAGSSLDVLNRWKVYRDDPRFVRALDSPIVRELVSEIDRDSESTQWLLSLA